MKLLYLDCIALKICWDWKALLGLVLVMSIASAKNYQHSSPSRYKEKQIDNVPYCELVNSPEKYDGKLIRTKVILIATIVPTIDAGESTIYHRDCNIKMLTDYGFHDPPSSKLEVKLKKLFYDSKRNGQGRAFIVLVGHFQVAKKGGFGNFSSFYYKINLAYIESAKNVSKKTTW